MSTEPFVSDVSITTGNSEHCSAPDTAQAPGCSCECPPTCPAKTEPKSTTGQSIRYSTGEISYRVNDLPSLTAGGIPWGHSRSFTPQLEFDQNVGQGWNWHVAHVPYLILRDTEVIVMGRGLAELWFDRDENTFAPRFGIKQQLTYNATTQNYTLRSVDGDLQIFDNEGLFLRQVDPAGNQLVVEALLTGTQLPASIKRVTGDVTEQYAYSYTSGGPAGSLLTEVVLRRKVGSGSWQNVASAIYTYYASGNPFGDNDDLQTVTTRSWQNSAWQDTGTTLYRYYLPQAASSGSSGAIPAQRGHLLRYVVKPSSFDRLAADPAVSDPLTAANSLVALYADYYFEFDEARRVTREVRSSGSQIFDYEYTTSSFSAAHNHWHTKTVETRPDGSRHVVFTNADGRVLLKSLETGVSPALEEWIDYYRYNTNGYVEFHAHPDAVIGYDEELPDLVEYSPSTNTATYLYNNTGLIERYTYHAPTAWLTSESVQEGLAGTPRVVREMEYIPCCHGGTSSSSSSGSSSSGGSSSSSEPCRYFLSQETLYRDENATTAAITTYDYTFYEGTCAIHERVTTLPLVSLVEHGSGVNNTRREVYDLYGRLTWSRDERGVITHFVYDELTGSLIQRIDDADTALLTGVPTALSSLWETLPQFGLHAITDFTVDPQGRTLQSLGPVHNIDLAGTATAVRTASWMLYDDANHTSYSAQGYIKTSDSSATLVNPISITIADSAGKTLVSAHATLSSTAGDLATCLSTHGPVTQADYTRLSTFQYTECCLAASQRAYHTIPTTGEGSPGTHYDQTSFGYDALKRRVRTVSPGGTISAVVLDPRGLTLSTYIGTNDNGATEQDPTGATAPGGSHPSNNMVLVSAAEYDIAGRLILSTQHVDSSTTRETSYSYDYRGRRLVTQGEENFCQKETYDFRGQLIRSERYDGSPTGTLLSRSETDYDALGRPYQSRRYAVNPSTGSVGNALIDRTWYDASGQVVKSLPSGSKLFTKSQFDGLGRTVATFAAYDLDESAYADAFDLSDDIVIESSHTTFDLAGHALSSTSKQRYHTADDTEPGELGHPTSTTQPQARVTHSAMWHDGIGRTLATANYGTNGGSAFTRPALIPARSDTILVSSQTYDEAGNLFETTDPTEMTTRFIYDDAGRRTQVIENYVASPVGSDENRTTNMTYSADGQLATLVAVNASTGNQTTTYTYGTTLADSEIAASSLLRSVAYPDSTGSSDKVFLTYNRQGQRLSLTDQIGTVHHYEYDGLGRLTEDQVATLGTGVNGAIRRLATTYDERGLVHQLTSFDAATSGNAVNQVQFTYNDFGQSIQTFQEHDGTVNTGTSPNVQMAYADGSTNTVRLLSLTYPNGRELTYDYGTTHEINDALSRIGSIVDDDTTHLVDYEFLGLAGVIQQTSPQPNLRYTLAGVSNDPDTGDIYTGLDRFGRVKDSRWYKTSTNDDLSRIQYGYDRASNRIWRKNPIATANSAEYDWLYTYDGLQRLKTAHRGTLNNTQTALTSTAFKQDWNLDPTGNWEGFKQSDNGSTWSIEQERTANPVNEITDITNTVGSPWADPAYNAVGNMTTIPKPKQMDEAYTATYDAWNRLVKLEEEVSSTLETVAEYQYDARNFRIVVKNYTAGVVNETTHAYFTDGWQNIEERTDSNSTPSQHHIWGLRYIDDCLLRDRTTDSTLDERLYPLQDANWNVTTIVDQTGDVQERFEYDAYGSKSTFNSFYIDPPLTITQWTITFAAYHQDRASSLLNVRNRDYSASISSWLIREPHQYRDGMNLLEYVSSRPLTFIDPLGLGIIQWIYTGQWSPSPEVYESATMAAGQAMYGTGAHYNTYITDLPVSNPGTSAKLGQFSIGYNARLFNPEGYLAPRIQPQIEANLLRIEKESPNGKITVGGIGASAEGHLGVSAWPPGIGAGGGVEAHGFDAIYETPCSDVCGIKTKYIMTIRFASANIAAGFDLNEKSAISAGVNAEAKIYLIGASQEVQSCVQNALLGPFSGSGASGTISGYAAGGGLGFAGGVNLGSLFTKRKDDAGGKLFSGKGEVIDFVGGGVEGHIMGCSQIQC